MSSVSPSGLTVVEIGWSTVKSGRSGKPGFSVCNVDPRAAKGVMLMPVGNSSDFGKAFFCCASPKDDRHPRAQTQPSVQSKRLPRRMADLKPFFNERFLAAGAKYSGPS